MIIGITMLCSNHIEWTKATLRTLFMNTPKNLFDLVVLDNGSNDGTPDFLLTQNCWTIFEPENTGVAKGRNKTIHFLLDKGIYDFICFIHNDMLFTPHWLEDSINCLLTIQPNSVLGIANIIGSDFLSLTDYQISSISACAKNDKYALANLEPRFYPVRLFKDIGFLDEIYNQSEAEDVDFNIRITQSGYNLTATNRVNCFHALGYTRLKLSNNMQIRSKNYNLCINKYTKPVFDKHNYASKDTFFYDGLPYTRYGV